MRISQRIDPRPKTSARSSTVSSCAAGLLGSHVRGRPDHRAGPRVARVGAGAHRADAARVAPAPERLLLVDDAPLVENLGQPPVHHLDLAEAADHHVRRLQVAVDDAPGVGVRHRLADLLEDREEPGPVVRRVFAGLQQRGQGSAPDQLHRDIQPAVREPADLVDRDDTRVLELAADLGLLDEPADHLGVVAVLLQDDLDGQVAAEVDVPALEDRPHAAAGDLADQLVAAGSPARSGISVERGLTGRRSSAEPSRSRTRGTGPMASPRVSRTPETGNGAVAPETGRRGPW